MKSSTASTLPAPTAMRTESNHTWLESLARKAVFHRLRSLEKGQIQIIENGETQIFGKVTEACPLSVTIHVDDPGIYADVAFNGSIGSGEAYMKGYWRCDDLTQLVQIFVLNRDMLLRLERGWARLAMPLNKLFHWLHSNTQKGSRQNIRAHYDLGNDLFRLFLDQSMTYSSGIFPHENSSLEAAQYEKYDRLCRKLDIQASDHVLEIGTGWGGFAMHAAQHYGCHVTTTTISQAQYNLARQRIDAAGLSDQISLLLMDYRDLEGQYDKLVSIEMIEAVGQRFIPTYFERCNELLKPGGMMALQAITIADQYYAEATRSVDFIQRYIFPGGFLPSVTSLNQAIAKTTDMRLFHLEDIGPHYATTLKRWRERFLANLDQVKALNYPDSFIRMWEYYLCYCEGGFKERTIGTVQMLLTKPQCRRAALVPQLA